MKSVLISIQPKWCSRIINGEKTIEVRKTKPNLQTPFKCYIYMTQGKLKDLAYYDEWTYENRMKVIGEFVCDKIEDFSLWEFDYGALLRHIDLYAGTNGDYKFLNDYLKGKKDGYGWHISDLKIYDKPKELSEFYHYCGDYPNCEGCKAYYFCNTESGREEYCCSQISGHKSLNRPPQSWQYVKKNYDV